MIGTFPPRFSNAWKPALCAALLLSPATRAATLAPAELVVEEGAGAAAFTVTLPAPADATVQVAVAGSAVPGADFTLSATSVVFTLAGPTRQSVRVEALRDGAVEGPERAALRLVRPDAAAAETGAPLQLVVRDADSLLVMSANLTSGRYQQYEATGVRLFQGLRPDVVAVQEFTPAAGTRRSFVDAAFGTGFAFHVESEASDNIPNGVISRWPIIASGEWTDLAVPNRDFAWATVALPGGRRLHVVSLHLYASGSPRQRAEQGRSVVAYARRQFPAGDFIVVAGDLNAKERGEPVLAALGELVSDAHQPVDPQGDPDTNVARSKPLDYVLPNPQLDALHRPLPFMGGSYPEGLVFDSRQWPELPWPVRAEDSGVAGMQHLPVLKLFALPAAP